MVSDHLNRSHCVSMFSYYYSSDTQVLKFGWMFRATPLAWPQWQTSKPGHLAPPTGQNVIEKVTAWLTALGTLIWDRPMITLANLQTSSATMSQNWTCVISLSVPRASDLHKWCRLPLESLDQGVLGVQWPLLRNLAPYWTSSILDWMQTLGKVSAITNFFRFSRNLAEMMSEPHKRY